MGNLDLSDLPVHWTAFEDQINLFRRVQCVDQDRQDLAGSIERRFRESSLGIFLHHMNQVQLQRVHVQRDKLDRLRFDKDKKLEKWKTLDRRNDFCEDLLALVDELLRKNPTGKITVEYTLEKLDVLRLTASKVHSLDGRLRSLRGLRVLVLAGNCLSELHGDLLPRGLLALELCYNKLTRLDQLLTRCPPDLVYLGLARNYITQDVLGPLHYARNLYHLDLADNNIEDVKAVTEQCLKLANISSLVLVGNPCSFQMVAGYVDFISYKLPRLIFLDNEIVKLPSTKLKKEDYDLSGTLQIFIFRIMGLPQPPIEKINNKKVLHSFRIEVACPLLEKYLPKRDESFIEDNSFFKENIENDDFNKDEKCRIKNKINEKSYKTIKSKEKQKKTTDNLKKNLLNPSITLDQKENRDNLHYEREILNTLPDSKLCFVSERKSWGKLIEFNTVSIEISDCDLTALRNVFRTNLVMYIVHLKTLLPPSKKPLKKIKEENTIHKDGTQELERSINKEILISRTVVAKIKIPLINILWNIRTLDYIWSRNNPLKVEQSQGLQDLQYAVKEKNPRKNKKGEDKSAKLQIPKILTCHIGVGVKR